VESKSGSKKGEESDLNGGVVDHLVLCSLIFGITVLELSSDGTVPSRDCDTTCQHATGLEHDRASYPSQSAVDERRRAWLDVSACLGIDVREAGKHADMGDFDLVEEEEAVIHGAKEMSANGLLEKFATPTCNRT